MHIGRHMYTHTHRAKLNQIVHCRERDQMLRNSAHPCWWGTNGEDQSQGVKPNSCHLRLQYCPRSTFQIMFMFTYLLTLRCLAGFLLQIHFKFFWGGKISSIKISNVTLLHTFSHLAKKYWAPTLSWRLSNVWNPFS